MSNTSKVEMAPASVRDKSVPTDVHYLIVAIVSGP